MSSHSNHPDTFIVIAAYYEEQSISKVVGELLPHYSSVVVVDDGSRDLTAQKARNAGATVLRHVINLGQGAALQTGIDYALQQGAKYIVTFDADGQHQVSDIAPMIAALQKQQADIALGSRFLGDAINLTWQKKWVLKCSILFTFLTTGIMLTDSHNGFRVLTRECAQKVRIRQNRMAHASEFIEWIRILKLNYVEVPVTIHYTDYSMAKGQKISGAVAIIGDLISRKI